MIMRTRFKKMKQLALMLFCFSLFFISTSCEDKNKSGGDDFNPNKPVELTKFYPTEGGISTRLIIEGSNFGTDPSKVKVLFNDKNAAVISCSNNMIYCLVPRTPGTNCTLTVKVEDNSATFEEEFNYLRRLVVSTISGAKGTDTFKEGTLATATFGKVNGLVTDNNNNLFFTHVEGGGVVGMLNESDNMVKLLVKPDFTTEIPTIIPNTQIILAPARNGLKYYILDPSIEWIPRQKTILHPTDQQQQELGYVDFSANTSDQEQFAYAYCKHDGFVYTRYRNNELIKFDPVTSIGSRVAVNIGDGPGSYQVFDPIDPRILYILYSDQHCIYTYNVETNEYKLFAGKKYQQGWLDGKKEDALFRYPTQMTTDVEGNIYLTDKDNHCIRMINKEGFVSTIAGIPEQKGLIDGTPEEAMFEQPRGITINSVGDIYISDGNRVIRKLTIQ